jgi:hypothetical protein
MKYEEQCDTCKPSLCTQDFSFMEDDMTPEGIVRTPLPFTVSQRNGRDRSKSNGQKDKLWKY